MKKNILRILLVLSFIPVFFLGRYQGAQYAKSYFLQLNEEVMILNEVPAYWGYTSISKNIESGKLSTAKCTTDLLASAKFEKLQSCLQLDECKARILDEVKKTAPELLIPESKEFIFYKNLKHCY